MGEVVPEDEAAEARNIILQLVKFICIPPHASKGHDSCICWFCLHCMHKVSKCRFHKDMLTLWWCVMHNLSSPDIMQPSMTCAVTCKDVLQPTSLLVPHYTLLHGCDQAQLSSCNMCRHTRADVWSRSSEVAGWESACLPSCDMCRHMRAGVRSRSSEMAGRKPALPGRSAGEPGPAEYKPAA